MFKLINTIRQIKTISSKITMSGLFKDNKVLDDFMTQKRFQTSAYRKP